MGYIVKAACPCGYTEEKLAVGVGMSIGVLRLDLASCDHCRRISSVRTSDPVRCKYCGRDAQPVELAVIPNDEDEGEYKVDFDALYRCPRCHEEKLLLPLDAVWD